jgi:5'-nucleotidase / UDP-sugar diphosphatase
MKSPLLKTFLAVSLLAAAALGWAGPGDKPLELTILHVNDTHSMLEPASVRLTLDIDSTLTGKAVYVNMGGFPAAMAAVSRLRSEAAGSVLFLHAGDLFQGSLYFTKYNGAADVDFWNAMRVDVATFGNHEFDKGPGLIQSALLEGASFPFTSANVDFSREPAVTAKARVPSYLIKVVGGQKVGIIGITTPETPFISSPGKSIVFRDPAESVDAAVSALERQGVNKILVISHSGLDADRRLAAKVHGVDAIIGGHSHTLLGAYPSLGLKGVERYPVTVKGADGEDVRIVQAWQWADQVGRLVLSFDADGKVVSSRGEPVFVVDKGFARVYDLPNLAGEKKRVQFTQSGTELKISEYDGSRYAVAVSDDPDDPADQYDAYAADYRKLEEKLGQDSNVVLTDPDPAGAAMLAGYAKGVTELKNTVVANVTEDMKRGHNSGPGPIIADSMTWKTGAQVAIMNPGGVRVDLSPGELTVARVYELQPFGNTLVTVTVTGGELIRVLEDMADFTISSYGTKPGTNLLYVAGMRLTLNTGAQKGKRVSDVRIGQADGGFSALSPGGTYTLVVNSFMAAGGDKNPTLASLQGKYDTGYIDSEAMLAYVDGKTLSNLREERVRLAK